MDLEIGVNDDTCAFILASDLKKNKRIIYIGFNEKKKENKFKEYRDIWINPNILKYPTYMNYFTNNVEHIISHESIHIAIFSLTKNIETTRMFDNIDTYCEITGFTPP